MPNPLTNSSQISCPHQGTVKPASSAKLTIGGSPVLLSDEWSVWKIVACTTPLNPNTPTKPCEKVVSLSNGEAGKLSVGGVPVLLGSAEATADGIPEKPPIPPTLSFAAGETKVQVSGS